MSIFQVIFSVTFIPGATGEVSFVTFHGTICLIHVLYIPETFSLSQKIRETYHTKNTKLHPQISLHTLLTGHTLPTVHTIRVVGAAIAIKHTGAIRHTAFLVGESKLLQKVIGVVKALAIFNERARRRHGGILSVLFHLLSF